MQNSQYGGCFFFEQLLLLSAYVELNPGPVTDKDVILHTIEISKQDLMDELRSVEHDIHTLSEDMNTMKQNIAK